MEDSFCDWASQAYMTCVSDWDRSHFCYEICNIHHQVQHICACKSNSMEVTCSETANSFNMSFVLKQMLSCIPIWLLRWIWKSRRKNIAQLQWSHTTIPNFLQIKFYQARKTVVPVHTWCTWWILLIMPGEEQQSVGVLIRKWLWFRGAPIYHRLILHLKNSFIVAKAYLASWNLHSDRHRQLSYVLKWKRGEILWCTIFGVMRQASLPEERGRVLAIQLIVFRHSRRG